MKPRRLRDPNQVAEPVVDITTGEVQDTISQQKCKPSPRQGQSGGLKGGKARAISLTPEKRRQIAIRAAQVRSNLQMDE